MPVADTVQFARIPAALFLMGSDTGQDDKQPVHAVEVNAFACALYPVTQAQYADFLHATGIAENRPEKGHYPRALSVCAVRVR